MGSYAPFNGIGQQTGQTALGGGDNPLQGGGTVGGLFGGMTTPAPMQNPFLGGQGMSAAQMNPQQYRAAPVPNADLLRQALGIPNDPGLTPYKLGQTLGGSSGGGMSQPMPAGWEPQFSSVNTTTEQDILRGRPGTTTTTPYQPGYNPNTPLTSLGPIKTVGPMPTFNLPTPVDETGFLPPNPPSVQQPGGIPYTTLPFQPAQIPPGMAPPGTPQRPANPMLQRVAQQIQNRGKALPSGIAGLLNRGKR